MSEVKLSQEEYKKIQRQLDKLNALELGGVDNWEYYDACLSEWYADNEVDELLDTAIENINDVLAEAKVDEPAGQGCGYSITFDEEDMKEYILKVCEDYHKIQNNK